MITGSPMDEVVVIDAQDAWTFSSEINSVMQQEPLMYVGATYIDAHTYRAILVRYRSRDDAPSLNSK